MLANIAATGLGAVVQGDWPRGYLDIDQTAEQWSVLLLQ